MKTYTAKEIAEILQNEGDSEATLRMVRYYTQIKLVPELELIGNKRVYTENHLNYFRAIRTMNKTGKKLDDIQKDLPKMSVEKVHKIAKRSNLFTTDSLYEVAETKQLEIEGIATITFHKEVSEKKKEKIEKIVLQIIKGEE